MDEMRKQLEELMSSVGVGANKPKNFTDANVCKHHLTGLCPHSLFHNTKLFLGPCSRTHADELQAQYMTARVSKYYGFEEDSLRYIKPLIDNCDVKVQKLAMNRSEDVDQVKASMQNSMKKDIAVLEGEIQERTDEAQKLGAEGDISASMAIMQAVAKLEARKKQLEEDVTRQVDDTSMVWFQKLRPCEICSALLSEKDDESRLTEHLQGRIHIGFDKLRKQYAALTEYLGRHKHLPRAEEVKDFRDVSGRRITGGISSRSDPSREVLNSNNFQSGGVSKAEVDNKNLIASTVAAVVASRLSGATDVKDVKDASTTAVGGGVGLSGGDDEGGTQQHHSSSGWSSRQGSRREDDLQREETRRKREEQDEFERDESRRAYYREMERCRRRDRERRDRDRDRDRDREPKDRDRRDRDRDRRDKDRDRRDRDRDRRDRDRDREPKDRDRRDRDRDRRDRDRKRGRDEDGSSRRLSGLSSKESGDISSSVSPQGKHSQAAEDTVVRGQVDNTE